MWSYIVLRPFWIGEVYFKVGVVVTDPIYVSLFDQESSYGAYLGRILTTPDIDPTPVPSTTDRDLIFFEIDRAKAAEAANEYDIAAERVRALAAEAGLLPATGTALASLLVSLFATLPTVPPNAPGILWNNGGTVSIS
jgi:hypothetical protein